MFRRIEFIRELSAEGQRKIIQTMGERDAAFKDEFARFWKTGIMGATEPHVVDALTFFIAMKFKSPYVQKRKQVEL